MHFAVRLHTKSDESVWKDASTELQSKRQKIILTKKPTDDCSDGSKQIVQLKFQRWNKILLLLFLSEV